MKSKAEIERITQKFLKRHHRGPKPYKAKPFHSRDFVVVAGSFENGKNR